MPHIHRQYARNKGRGNSHMELKAEGEEESAHEFNKGLAIAQQVEVGGFVSKKVFQIC
jgi:hypothetical protein